jgi:hypothetical protein
MAYEKRWPEDLQGDFEVTRHDLLPRLHLKIRENRNDLDQDNG